MSTYQKYLDTYTRGFMGFNTLAILGQSSLGGFTAMVVLYHGNSLYQMIQLFFVIILTSIFNGTVLAQMKPKFVLNMLLFTVLFNIAVILANLFFIY